MAPNSHTIRTTRRRMQSLDMGASLGVNATTLDDHLPSIARLIEERAFAADDGPRIVRITRDGIMDEGVDVGIRRIDDIDDSVVSTLTGFVAPMDWLAIGVSTGGNAYPIEQGPDAPRRRVRLVHLVSRLGLSVSVVRLAEQEPRVLVGNVDDGTIVGRVDDVCRRALRLATPPAGNTLEFWALMWLDSIVAAGTDEAPSTWDEVAAHHLAVRVFAEAEPHLVAEASATLVRLGVLAASVHGWSELRAECVAGRWSVESVPPDVARWLDDGAFSRWTIGTFPPRHELTAAACELLSPTLARRVRAVLREWGLDPPV